MSNKLLLPVLLAAFVIVGCGKKETPGAGANAASSAPAPANASQGPIEITANDMMKFSLTRFEVTAGQEVKLVLTNIGSMPKAAMGHNLVILKKTADIKAFVDASVGAMANDYFPAQLADQVVAHTKLLGPKQIDEITFTAPSEPGEYPFVCTFPAHFVSGMKGVMVVK